MENKKIDVIVKYFFPVTAGIEVNVMETYRRLAEKGWDVTIHTSANTYLEKNILPKFEIIRGLKIKRYPFYWYGFFPDIDYSNAGIIALHNFDIFPHFHILLCSLILKTLGRKNFKLFLTPHGGFNPEWSTFSTLQALIKKQYHYILGTRLINKAVDKVRAVSGWEQQEMIDHGVNPKIIKIIENGVEDEAYMDVDSLASNNIKNQVKSFGKYIIQIGRIYRIKNYETTIKALSKLPKDINYIIAGPVQEENTYINKLRVLIQSLGLEDRVKFIGVVSGIDKYYLIKRAQMMVHMALWESYCNVVHEGLSQGLVCIVANNTALPHLIRNGVNGYCVGTLDYKNVAEKINFVLKNRNKKFIKNMKERNKLYGLENSWKIVAEKVDKLFKNSVQLRTT